MRRLFIAYLLFSSNALLAQTSQVNVNGNNFNYVAKGLDNRKPQQPVIIFENGMGVDLENWKKITDEVSQFAPVFAYDRAGIGKSDKGSEMPTVQTVSANLHGILNLLKIAPPYVLVGHSLGGVFIRAYAGFYPNEVAGLVFIDPADFTETKNDWNAIFRAMGLPEKKIDDMLQQRLYQPSSIDGSSNGPARERKLLNELRKSDFAEISLLPLPKVPVYFFVGGKFEVPPEQRSKDFDQESFFHVKNNSNMERWKKLIYATGKAGALIYLTNAGHYIHWDDPASVVSNLKVLMEKLRANN